MDYIEFESKLNEFTNQIKNIKKYEEYLYAHSLLRMLVIEDSDVGDVREYLKMGEKRLLDLYTEYICYATVFNVEYKDEEIYDDKIIEHLNKTHNVLTELYFYQENLPKLKMLLCEVVGESK